MPQSCAFFSKVLIPFLDQSNNNFGRSDQVRSADPTVMLSAPQVTVVVEIELHPVS